MKNSTKAIELTSNQKEILQKFIQTFLPMKGNKRKSSGNEVEYVSSVFKIIFTRYFGFKVTGQNILDAFEALGYDIYTQNGNWDSETKTFRPSKSGELVRVDDIYPNYNAMYVYINIEALTVRQLRLSVFTPLPNTTDEKKTRHTRNESTSGKIQTIF